MSPSTAFVSLIRPPSCIHRRAGSHAAHLAQQPLVRSGVCPRLPAPPQASPQESVSSMDIQDLPPYCDDFECKSSPAVEQTIRSYGRDLERCNGRWTRSLLARDVEYKDMFRTCRGQDAYLRLDFASSRLKGAQARVTQMRMLDNGVAVVSWRLAGSLGPIPVDVGVESQLTLSLLTGTIEKQRDTWDLSRCSPPAALAWMASRALWAAQQEQGLLAPNPVLLRRILATALTYPVLNSIVWLCLHLNSFSSSYMLAISGWYTATRLLQASMDAKLGTERVLNSLSSVDEEDSSNSLQRNPADPTRFFQQNDNTMQDAFAFSAFVALLWFVAQAYGRIFTL